MGCFHSKTLSHAEPESKQRGTLESISARIPRKSLGGDITEHVDDLLEEPGQYPDDESSAQEICSLKTDVTESLRRPSVLSSKNSKAVKQTDFLNVGVLEGTTFLNNYLVVDTLGRGSFGKVKLCLNVADVNLYAVKVVETVTLKHNEKSKGLHRRSTSHVSKEGSVHNGNLAAEDSILNEIRREVQVMMALDHPNLVKLYEVIKSRDSGKLLMVMEYCEGGNLIEEDQLAPDKRMPEVIAQHYFKQAAAGLNHLHSEGIVHGDIKPENMLLAGDGSVKISDFGQSQLLAPGESSKLSKTLGTPAFLAPEICAGEDYDGFAADIWALGITLYLFIFGTLPFKGESLIDLYDQIADSQITFPENVPLSLNLQDLFLRLLNKNAEFRITTKELLQHPWIEEYDLLHTPIFLDEEDINAENLELDAKMGTSVDSMRPESPGGASPEEIAAVVFPICTEVSDFQQSTSLSSKLASNMLIQMQRRKSSAMSPMHTLSRDSMMVRGNSSDSEDIRVANPIDNEASESEITFKSIADKMQETQAHILGSRNAMHGKSRKSGVSLTSVPSHNQERDGSISRLDAPQWTQQNIISNLSSQEDALKLLEGPLSIISEKVNNGIEATMSRSILSPFEAVETSTTVAEGSQQSKNKINAEDSHTAAIVPHASLQTYGPGEKIAFLRGDADFVYYIDRGTVQLNWEADLPVSLEEVFGNVVYNIIPSHGSTTLEHLDSTAFAEPSVTNLSLRSRSNFELKNYPVLRTVEKSAASFFSMIGTKAPLSEEGSHDDSVAASATQILQRAEEMVKNAVDGSLDNLLVSMRQESQFIGALSMLDPAYFGGKWCSVAIAKDEVTIIKMDREGLDRFLVQNPLSQVHLRASMATTASEIMKLETLEKIALAKRKISGTSSTFSLPTLLGNSFEGAAKQISETVNSAATSAKLDLFALVGKLREGLNELGTSKKNML
eukprot:jgi/Picsp_1/6076/NSC_03430-R1_serine threonine protein kinase 3